MFVEYTRQCMSLPSTGSGSGERGCEAMEVEPLTRERERSPDQPAADSTQG